MKMSLATSAGFPRLAPAVEIVIYRPSGEANRAAHPPLPADVKRRSLLLETLFTVLFTGIGVASWAVASATEHDRVPHVG
jgi:hypothetical protein